MSANTKPRPGEGVRTLRIADQLPDCPVAINRACYNLAELSRGKRVVDIGCGYGRTRPIVEGAGGEWIGVEPFEGGAHTVVAQAEDLPFDDASIDVVLMNAVLEHVEDPDACFAEISRVLKPGGSFVGYVAFMECFHEISYNHLSYMALQFYARKHGMALEAVSGGGSFGIDYHFHVLFYPLPLRWMRPIIAGSMRGVMRTKAALAYAGLRAKRRLSHREASGLARSYYQLECLRQSAGFEFLIRKPAG